MRSVVIVNLTPVPDAPHRRANQVLIGLQDLLPFKCRIRRYNRIHTAPLRV